MARDKSALPNKGVCACENLLRERGELAIRRNVEILDRKTPWLLHCAEQV